MRAALGTEMTQTMPSSSATPDFRPRLTYAITPPNQTTPHLASSTRSKTHASLADRRVEEPHKVIAEVGGCDARRNCWSARLGRTRLERLHSKGIGVSHGKSVVGDEKSVIHHGENVIGQGKSLIHYRKSVTCYRRSEIGLGKSDTDHAISETSHGKSVGRLGKSVAHDGKGVTLVGKGVNLVGKSVAHHALSVTDHERSVID
jgi:hypothetical protein